MSKVKKLLGIGCGTSLAVIVGLGAILWVRGNAAPEYKIPQWKLPIPNAYDTLEVARNLEVTKLGDIATSPITRFDEKLGKSVPEKPQPLAGRKRLLGQNEASIAKLREALKQDYAVDIPPGDVGAMAALFPRQADIRELARMLLFASHTYADLGQKDKAAECALDAMALGVLIVHRSQLIGNLVGIACEAIGRKALWELTDNVDAKTARTATARLEFLERQRYSFEKVLLTERDFNQAISYTTFKSASAWQLTQNYAGEAISNITGLEAMKGEEPETPSAVDRAKQLCVQTGMTAELVWHTKKRIFAESGRYMTELATQSTLPYDPNRSGPPVPSDPLNQSLMSIFAQAGQKDTAARAETALVRVYLLLRAHRLEHGSYPATLSELVTNGYLKALPNDPFAPRFGQTFGYRREPDGKFTLWSCGPDGDDDNGRAIVAQRNDGTPRRYVQLGDEGDMVARVNTY